MRLEFHVATWGLGWLLNPAQRFEAWIQVSFQSDITLFKLATPFSFYSEDSTWIYPHLPPITSRCKTERWGIWKMAISPNMSWVMLNLMWLTAKWLDSTTTHSSSSSLSSSSSWNYLDGDELCTPKWSLQTVDDDQPTRCTPIGNRRSSWRCWL